MVRSKLERLQGRDFLSGPVVKNLPCQAGDAGEIPGCRTRIPHAEAQ